MVRPVRHPAARVPDTYPIEVRPRTVDLGTDGGEATMGFSLSDFFQTNRDPIIRRWVDLLKTQVGEQYAARPRRELLGTVSKAYDAEVDVILNNDFAKINAFICDITRMRLEAGFLLSDVQKAFELFRRLAIERLVKDTTLAEFADSVMRMNRCLDYTIHRFSDYFQTMHEKQILAHNRRLEAEVRARTEELAESELNYKTLVEEINDGYFVVQDQVMVFANRAFCRMHGCALQEVLGRRFTDFVAPGDRGKVIGFHQDEDGDPSRPRTFEYLRLTSAKETFPTEIQSKVTQYNRTTSRIGICRDITGRVEMEKKVRESERMAYIGQITASLSHEIRNPLSAVKMNLQILKKNPRIRGNDRRRIDISAKEVNRLERILEEVLDFAKPLQLNCAPVDPNAVVSTALELLEMKFAEADMDIAIDLDPAMPLVNADGEKLLQALINILLNALEAAVYGSKLDIRTARPSDPADTVAVVIADGGHGIADRDRADIFKPFFTTKSSGTGLGLSNAQRIVEAHGGRIDIRSRSQGGTVCSILLPPAAIA